MRLQRLTSLEVQKIVEELEGLRVRILDYKDILGSVPRQYEIVSTELGEVNKTFVGKRATEVDMSGVETTQFEVTDLIAEEETVITITEDGFIKRTPLDTFRRQRRGGKGVRGTSLKKEDIIKMMNIATTHDTLLLFSDRGKIFAMKVHEIAEAGREARGKSLKALLNLSAEERITAICSSREFTDKKALVMVSRDGILKKSGLDLFASARKGGIIAINLRKEDELIDVQLVEPKDDILIASRMGLALRTNLAKMRSQGRSASGIIGMRLDEGDAVIGMDVVRADASLLVISENGYGKRMDYSNFTPKGRGGKGMNYIKITDKNGPAVSVCSVHEADDVIIICESGMTIRLNAAEIPIIGRSTVGVKVVNTGESDRVRDVAIITEEK
jgi:DNA gyrase subunit A